MRNLVLLLLIVCLSSCRGDDEDLTSPFTDDFINSIESFNTTWQAGSNFIQSDDLTFPHYLAGVLPDVDLHLPPPRPVQDVMSYEFLPEEFDAREKWFYCPSIGNVQDQGPCGSCWAVASVNTISDRICIHSGGEIQTKLSIQDALSCCGSMCGLGCKGGYPPCVYVFWTTDGIVSGGDYGTSESCKPYLIEPCERDATGRKRICKAKEETPRCIKDCQANFTSNYTNDLHFGKNYYSLEKNEADIRRDIFLNGPVTASFTAYSDFTAYKKGIYQHVTGTKIGGHAVKIIGWGEEAGVRYWLVVNSWGKFWGENGTFKILRGENHLKFEQRVVTGMPKFKENE